MDIGPTELPIQPVLPSDGIRRVERSSDARQNPQRRQPQDEPSEEGEHEAPHDSVDVSATYRLAHPEHADAGGGTSLNGADAPDLTPHLDIEA